MADDAKMQDAIRWMWSLGDYGALAVHLEPHAVELAQRSRLQAGSEVLDVAAGNGNFAIAAARLGATVVATDLTPTMVGLGRSRSESLRLGIEWREADAEQLPFPDERFDVVASVFGAMFAPHPDRVASELFRVAKRGGLVAMATDGPKGFLPRFTALMAERGPAPPPGMHSPFEWGVTDEVHRRFKGLTSSIEICIFMKPASTSNLPLPRTRRTRAGSRTSFKRTRTPSSTRRGCMRSCRESSCVESTVVWKSSRSSRFAFDTRRCAS